MTGVATAIAGSAIVSAGAMYLGSRAQQKGISEGIAAQTELSNQNLQLQRELADTQRADFEPWRQVGQKALRQLQQGIDSGAFEVGKIDVTQDPGYQFRMKEGIDALDASASARGRLQSGAQAKGVQKYAQGLASQEYANAYAREANKKARQYNMLSQLSGAGQASAAQQAGATGRLAETSGNIMQNLGQNKNVAAQNIGASRAGAYQGGAQVLNQAAQNWLTHQQLKPQPAPVGPAGGV